MAQKTRTSSCRWMGHVPEMIVDTTSYFFAIALLLSGDAAAAAVADGTVAASEVPAAAVLSVDASMRGFCMSSRTCMRCMKACTGG